MMSTDEQISELWRLLNEKREALKLAFPDRCVESRNAGDPTLPARIAELYKEGSSTFEVADELDISQSLVNYYLRKTNTPRRSTKESVKLSHARGRGKNRYLVINKKRLMIVEWSALSGTPANQITQRLARGWTPSDAVWTPSLTERCEHNKREMDCSICREPGYTSERRMRNQVDN